MWLEEVERYGFRFPAPKICIAEWLVDVGVKFGVAERAAVAHPDGHRHRPLRPAHATRPATDRSRHALSPSSPEGLGRRACACWRSCAGAGPTRASSCSARVRPRAAAGRCGVRVLARSAEARGRGLQREPRVRAGEQPRGLRVHRGRGDGVRQRVGHHRQRRLARLRDSPARPHSSCRPATSTGSPAASSDCSPTTNCALASRRAGEQHVQRFDWDLSGEILEAKLRQYLADPSSFQHPPLAEDSEREEVR